jgi:ABC-type nitrate/sulfonate/bicarbonate transport system permease component
VSAQTVPLKRSRHPRGDGRTFWRPSERLVFGVLGFVGVILLWEIASSSDFGLGWVKRVQLSSPTLIVEAAIDEITSGAIWPHLLESSKAYSLGLGSALLTGIPLGLAIGWFRRLNYVVDPWLSAIYATPSVALIPLIILIFGIDLEAKVIVVWLGTIFEITVSAAAGVHAADARFHDIARSFGASGWTTFRTVMLPASVPYILSGTRLATGRALVGVVVSEFLAANAGIGFYISLNGSFFNTANVFFGVIILGIVGLALGEIVRRIEKRFDRWRPALS